MPNLNFAGVLEECKLIFPIYPFSATLPDFVRNSISKLPRRFKLFCYYQLIYRTVNLQHSASSQSNNRTALGLQNPRAAHRPAHKTFRLAVIHETPELRVPLQRPIQTRDNLPQKADSHRAATNLDIADGMLSTTNAVQKVLSMVRVLVEVHVIGLHPELQQTVGRCPYPAPAHPHPAFVAYELHITLVRAALLDQRNTIGVSERKTIGIRPGTRRNLDRPITIHAHTPLGNIKMMSPPVGHMTRRILTP